VIGEKMITGDEGEENGVPYMKKEYEN